MSVDISDMLLFVNKLSELNLPTDLYVPSQQFNELSDDAPVTFGKVFDEDVKVKKVRGV